MVNSFGTRNFGHRAGCGCRPRWKKIEITCFGWRGLKGCSRIGEIDDEEWYIFGTGSTAPVGSDSGVSSVDRPAFNERVLRCAKG
jgi:hypothetical protein